MGCFALMEKNKKIANILSGILAGTGVIPPAIRYLTTRA
jgi:hypothetical protein